MKTAHNFLMIFCCSALFMACHKENISKEDNPTSASYLYYAVYYDSMIGRIDLKNGNTTSVFAKGIASGFTVSGQTGLAINSSTGDLFCTVENTNGPIYKINSAGIATVLYDGTAANEPGGIAYSSSNNKIYWQNRGDGKIYSLSIAGGTPTAMYGGVDVHARGYSIKLDEKNGKIYYANFQKIYRGNLDGSGMPEVLYDSRMDTLNAPSSLILDVDNNRIYWTDEIANIVASAALDGSGDIHILYNNAEDGILRSDGLAIDFLTKKIYWTETNTTNNRIRVANLDGSGTPMTLISGAESYNLILK